MGKTELNQTDPLTKQPEQGEFASGLSPMDPPDAYDPPALDRVPVEETHPFLRKLHAEHVAFLEQIKIFEDAIIGVQTEGFTKERDRDLRHFFHYFESDFVPHSRREETHLFPLLNERLLAEGEHSRGATTITSIDLMEDDHLKAVQLAAVVLNFLGLVFRLKDEESRLVVLDAALEQGKNLVELLRLHIFREDNIVFPSAHRLISTTQFDSMQPRERGPG